MSQLITQNLRAPFLYNSIGVAADVSHINTASKVTGYDQTPSALRECLTGADVVIIPAGVPRKPGMTRDGMSIIMWY